MVNYSLMQYTVWDWNIMYSKGFQTTVSPIQAYHTKIYTNHWELFPDWNESAILKSGKGSLRKFDMPIGLDFGVPLVLKKGTKDQFCQQPEDPELRLRHARNRKWIFRGYSNHIDGPSGGWAQYERWGDYYSLDYSSCLTEIQGTV